MKRDQHCLLTLPCITWLHLPSSGTASGLPGVFGGENGRLQRAPELIHFAVEAVTLAKPVQIGTEAGTGATPLYLSLRKEIERERAGDNDREPNSRGIENRSKCYQAYTGQR